MKEQESDGDESKLHARRCVMAALYLPGLPRPIAPRRNGASEVLRCLLRNPCEIGEAAKTLETAGIWEAALCLTHPGLLSKSENLVNRTEVLTLACPNYPSSWSRIGSAPPALWMRGSLMSVPAVGIVGSREPPEDARTLATETAMEAVRLGYSVVSGGAPGCDFEAGIAAGSHLIELLPCGIGQRWGNGTGCQLSAREPNEIFTTAGAMERNALIYAFGLGSVVCHARFKAGGAWVGATEALRRKLGHLLIWEDRANLASRALIALGGTPLPSAADLETALLQGERQQSLFA